MDAGEAEMREAEKSFAEMSFAEMSEAEKERDDRELQAMFMRLKAFKAQHGHCNVPKVYATDQQLANWVQLWMIGSL